MERLVLICLLSPAIFAQPLKSWNSNDEPFLPIHPVYPYSPKLIKRGIEREVNTQLTSDLYVPKVDAKDSYSSSYSNNYQRDYYPDYNPYSTNGTLSLAYPSYYNGGEAYVYANSPYPYNSYPAPYAVNPASYSVPSYPNYYYQPPYYYSHYFNHALFPPPPPPPSTPLSGVDYQASQVETEDGKQDADKKGERQTEDETSQDAPTSQFVDGGNYINGNSRDLDVQSSTYKVASPYNQLAQEIQVKTLPVPLPKTMYKVISVAAQPVGPGYALPSTYVKAQQIQQMTSQALADLLAQNAQPQAGGSYENSKDTSNNANDGSYENQDSYNPDASSYVTLSGARSKTGVTYVIDSVGTAKVNREGAKHQGSTSQKTPSETKYSNVYYVRKPASRNHSQSSYVSPENRNNHRDRVKNNRPVDQTDKYGSYDASHNYDGTYSQPGNKQEQNYGTYQSQPGSYQSKGFTQTPRSHSYQYSAYESDQVQQPQQDEIDTDDGNFGSKEYKE